MLARYRAILARTAVFVLAVWLPNIVPLLRGTLWEGAIPRFVRVTAVWILSGLFLCLIKARNNPNYSYKGSWGIAFVGAGIYAPLSAAIYSLFRLWLLIKRGPSPNHAIETLWRVSLQAAQQRLIPYKVSSETQRTP